MKVLKQMGIGLAIGFVLTIFFMTIHTGFNEFTIPMIAWAIASMLFGVSALVYQIKKLKLIQAFIIHFLCCLVIVGVNIFLFYNEYLVPVLISFAITYIVIYVIMYLIEKREIKKMNEKLNK